MLVAHAVRPFVAVSQEQAYHLETARRQDYLFCPYGEPLLVERL